MAYRLPYGLPFGTVAAHEADMIMKPDSTFESFDDALDQNALDGRRTTRDKR